MPERLEEQIRRLTPSALASFKRQLLALPEQDRERAFSRLSGIPELADTIGRPPARATQLPTQEQQVPLWQQGLRKVGEPFQWISEHITEPFGAVVTAPFTPDLPGGRQFDESPLAYARRQYEQWQEPEFTMPWGGKFRPTKGIVETLPWFALPTAGGISAKLAMAVKGGGELAKAAGVAAKVVKPIAAVEKAITYPISKPLEMAAKKILPKIAEKTVSLMPDLQPIDEAITIASQPSKLRNLVGEGAKRSYVFKSFADALLGQAATADNPAKLSLIGRAILRFEGANKATVAISTLARLGGSKKVFNLTDDGLMTIGKKQVHLNTIRTYPKRYWEKLSEPQRAWIEQAQILEAEKLALLERAGVKIPLLTFEEGGVYAGRRVAAKLTPEGELVDIAYVGVAQPRAPGAKLAAEKARVFENIDDALKEGYHYLPEEEALYYNITGAYNKVADKQFADWFLERVPWRTTAGPEDLKAQVNLFRTGVASAKESLKTAHKQLKQSARDLERQHGVTFRATEEVGDLLDDITTKQALRKNIDYLRGQLHAEKKYANKLANTYANAANRNEGAYQKVLDVEDRLTKRLAELSEVEPIWKDALAKARRAPFGGVVAPDIPAFAGKVFTSPEAKEYINIIRKELDPQFNGALNAVNQINSVGRFFALAGDASPFTIQLIFLGGAFPKQYGKAIGGFVKAMFDPLYHDNLLANNIALIQRHPGLILTKAGSTEMTEAMARGGLLRKQPFKLAGKALEPFQRGFEGALDTAGIELAGALEHLGTTPARMAQVDAFINEFRGLANTARIGVSTTERQLERALILAPQYNRAVGAMLFDITQGNLRGQLARQSLAKGVGAIMAMSVAVSYAIGETEEEIVDHLNPRSTNFLTWDVAGQRVGPGSKVRSLLATFGKMTKDPEDAAYHAGRFIQGNFAPFVGTTMDLITGKNFIGDPTRDGLPSMTRTMFGENLLPIWLQSVAFEGGDFSGRIVRALGEFGGLRTYPAGAYTEVKDLQDSLSQQRHGVSWDELGERPEGMVAQMKLTRESPELQELTKKAAEESERYAHGEQLVWNEYGKQTEHVGNVVTQELTQAAKQFEATKDGRRLRERVNQAYWLKAQMIDDLTNRAEFSVVKETFAKELTDQQRAEMPPQKLLMRDYNTAMYSPDMFDEFGEYRFDEAKLRREQFIQQYGLGALNSVESVIGEKRADEPDAVKLLRAARETLAPYWGITDRVWASYPPELKTISDQIEILERTDPRKAKITLYKYPQILRARELILRYRKLMREYNPTIRQAYRMFYG